MELLTDLLNKLKKRDGDKKGDMGLNYNYQVAIDSKNGMVVGQYLTQNATDDHELFEMLYEI